MTQEAQCPECRSWSPVAWDDAIPPGGVWWVDSGCCPVCDAPVAVESECAFRNATEDDSCSI